jgi:hypothetical protein
MKKLFTAAVALLLMSSVSFAQPGKGPAKEAKTTAKMKKDGTPDMRMKGSKEKATTTTASTHMKKDGTPDMRYKENKTKK